MFPYISSSSDGLQSETLINILSFKDPMYYLLTGTTSLKTTTKNYT